MEHFQIPPKLPIIKQWQGTYLMASLLEAFMISVAEGTPIRLNLIPYKKMNYSLIHNMASKISNPLFFYIYETYYCTYIRKTFREWF